MVILWRKIILREMSKFKKVAGCHVHGWFLYTGKKCITDPKHKACAECSQFAHYLCL